MEGGVFIGGVLILATALSFIILKPAINKRVKHRGSDSPIFDYQAAFGKSALIEYMPTEPFEEVTNKVVSKSLESGKPVVLFTQAPRAEMYREKFSLKTGSKRLKIVNITSENPLARPQMFRIGKQKEEDTRGKPNSELTAVSINNLEFAFEIVESLESGGVLVFEALTGIILGLGSEKKESAYKFFSSVIEELSKKDRTFVALLNSGAHEKETVSAYEGLFMRIFRIVGDSIISIKGEKKKILIERVKE